MTILGLPDHLRDALADLGVRMPDRLDPKPKAPQSAIDRWWTRGEECPH